MDDLSRRAKGKNVYLLALFYKCDREEDHETARVVFEERI